jgi:hypothetical protein
MLILHIPPLVAGVHLTMDSVTVGVRKLHGFKI